MTPVGNRNVRASRRAPGPSLARHRSCAKFLSSRRSGDLTHSDPARRQPLLPRRSHAHHRSGKGRTRCPFRLPCPSSSRGRAVSHGPGTRDSVTLAAGLGEKPEHPTQRNATFHSREDERICRSGRIASPCRRLACTAGGADGEWVAAVRHLDADTDVPQETRVAVVAHLSRYRGASRAHTESDLRLFFDWCRERSLARRNDFECRRSRNSPG